MQTTHHSLATIQDLEALPEGSRTELINGRLSALPRPTGAHLKATNELFYELQGPFSRKKGGPGGWLFVIEPQLYLVGKKGREHSMIPDIAGWRRERLAEVPRSYRFDITPDWVCEVISESSRVQDRQEKPPIYLSCGVSFYWLIEPEARELEVWKAAEDVWQVFGVFSREDKVKAASFGEVELDLSVLWIPREPTTTESK
jgi:Uma2 family endonuclease